MPSQFPRYVTSQHTGRGHTRVRPTMSCWSDIRKQQPSPCPKFRDIIAVQIHAPTFPTFSVFRFLYSTFSPSSSSQNPSQILSSHRLSLRLLPEPNAQLLRCLVPFRVIPKVTPSPNSRVVYLSSVSELQGLDYESPDDGELSDDTISNGKRPIPIDFNRTSYKSKVVDWRSDPRMIACRQKQSVTPSERTGDSFVSHFHDHTGGVEVGTWMLGNPNRAHADTYHH